MPPLSGHAERNVSSLTPVDSRQFAQACIDTGLMPEVVTKMMGHRTSDMVWTYARIRDEQMVEAAAKLKLRSDSA